MDFDPHKDPVARLPNRLFKPEEYHSRPPSSTEPERVAPPSQVATAASQDDHCPRWEPPRAPLRLELIPIESRAPWPENPDLAGVGTTVVLSHGAAVPADPVKSEPLILILTAKIRTRRYPFGNKILVADLGTDGPHLMSL
jgi:hypothetical protein